MAEGELKVSTHYLLMMMNKQTPHCVFLQDSKSSGLLNSLVSCHFFALLRCFLHAFPVKRGTSVICSQTHEPHGVLLRHLCSSSRSNRGELEKSPTKAEAERIMQKTRIQMDLCVGLNKYKVLLSASLKAQACLNFLGKWGALRRNWQALI